MKAGVLRSVLAGIVLLATGAAIAATQQLRSGESLVLGREDASGFVLVATDDPILRFAEVAGERALVRVTTLDRDGESIGSGRLVLILPTEQRELRLRDAFTTDLLRNTRLRVEVLEGPGTVSVSTHEEHGPALTVQVDATRQRRRAVIPGRGPQPTSRAIIDKAEAAGTLSSETALLYRVYALFSDARLPQQYRGDDSGLKDSVYMAEVRDRFDDLSPETQALILPFLTPPAYKGSWANASGEPPASAAVPPPCEDLSVAWTYVDAVDSPVRVWYRVGQPDEAAATRIATFIDTETVWTKLTGLMQRAPMPDDKQACGGGNSRLDLYLTDIAREKMIPYVKCVASPAFILLRRDTADWVVIHEIFHAFQFAFPMAACSRKQYTWWIESSAEWAIDFVRKDTDEEHATAEDFLTMPEQPLDFLNDKHEYGAYLLTFYVHRQTKNADFVRVAWENCANEPALEAVDHAIGGFAALWPSFARDNWNQNDIKDYRDWDRLQDTAQTPEHGHVPVAIGGKLDEIFPIDLDLPRLSATYKHYEFSDSDARSVAFWNGATFKVDLEDVPIAGAQYVPHEATAEQKKGAHVLALIKIGDKWTEDDWTNRPFVTYCRDTVAERLQELVIITSNSEFRDRERKLTPAGEKPFLWISNMGCWKWKGTATYDLSLMYGSNTVTAEVTWTRKAPTPGAASVTYQASGNQQWKVVHDPPPPGPQCDVSGSAEISSDDTLTTFNYIPSQGSFHRAYTALAATLLPIAGCFWQAYAPLWFVMPLPAVMPGMPFARFVQVSANGTVAADSYDSPTNGPNTGTGTWKWHFEAQRE